MFRRAGGSERAGEGVRTLAVEDLVGPQHDDHLVAADVGDVVGPARHGLDDLGLGAAGHQFVRLSGLHVAELEARLALDDKELLGLGVVVVTTARDSRVRREVAELAAVGCLEHLGKDAARVAVHRHGVGEGLDRQVADIGGVERAHQAGADALGHQRLAAVLEGLDQAGELADGAVVLRRHGGKAVGVNGRVGAIHQLQEAPDHVVDVDQLHRRGRFVDLDRQVARDVVAEGRHGRVVVGLAPLAEHVGQAEHMYRNAVVAL